MLLKLHKYAGLIAGLLLALTGVTGSLLVFHDALDETLTPGLVSDVATPLPLAEIIARADAAVADGSPQRIDLARQPGSPHTLRFPAPEGSPGPRQISVSPYSGEILADRIWGNYPMTWIYRLHYTLLAGTTGKIVVGGSVNDNYSAQDPAEIPATRGGLVEMGADFLAREDLRYINTFGREGTAPPWTSRAFPYGGFYIMRSDWSAAARYLVFDGGESAGGHNHVDKLSFELYAYGSTLVTDSGCGGPWASAWRSDYFVGPAGHNTIMVDGRGQVAGTPLFAIPSLAGRTSWREIAPEPLDNTWTTGAHFDYAASRYAAGYATYGSEQSRLRGFRYELNRVRTIEAMQPWTQTQAGPLQVKPHEHVFVDHERKVFFAKPDYWILSDRLLGRGRHKAESLFHFQASATAEIDKDGAVRTLNGAAGLTIMPHASSGLEARIVAGQHQPLQGWVPDGWGKHRPAPVAIFSTEAELPVTIDTVLFPYPRDEAPELRIERLDVAEQGALVEDWEASGLCIHNGQLRDYYLVAHERRALRRCGPLHTDAEVVMLRLSAAGTVVQLILVNGSYVEFENRPLVVAEHTFNTLELEWREDILDLRCHPRIGAVLEVGTARKLLINGAASSAISPTGGRLQIFENWLD